jgi:hypothetical protein
MPSPAHHFRKTSCKAPCQMNERHHSSGIVLVSIPLQRCLAEARLLRRPRPPTPRSLVALAWRHDLARDVQPGFRRRVATLLQMHASWNPLHFCGGGFYPGACLPPCDLLSHPRDVARACC